MEYSCICEPNFMNQWPKPIHSNGLSNIGNQKSHLACLELIKFLTYRYMSYCYLWNDMPFMLQSHSQTSQCGWSSLTRSTKTKFSIRLSSGELAGQSITSILAFCKNAIQTWAFTTVSANPSTLYGWLS